LQDGGGVAGLDAVGHISVRHLWRTASDAVDTTWSAGLLRASPPVGEKAAKLFAPNEDRTLIIDGNQALSKPGAHSILVDGEEA